MSSPLSARMSAIIKEAQVIVAQMGTDASLLPSLLRKHNKLMLEYGVLVRKDQEAWQAAHRQQAAPALLGSFSHRALAHMHDSGVKEKYTGISWYFAAEEANRQTVYAPAVD